MGGGEARERQVREELFSADWLDLPNSDCLHPTGVANGVPGLGGVIPLDLNFSFTEILLWGDNIFAKK